MNKQTNNHFQEEVEKKYQKKEKRKRKNMKISGGSVKRLQRLIIQKSKIKNQN